MKLETWYHNHVFKSLPLVSREVAFIIITSCHVLFKCSLSFYQLSCDHIRVHYLFSKSNPVTSCVRVELCS